MFGDDPLHFLETLPHSHRLGRPQPSTQQLVATENVQRQIALMVLVTMEEARFLLSMQWRVRSIQIQNDGPRCFPVGLQEQPRWSKI
jgi:hypothetical protein